MCRWIKAFALALAIMISLDQVTVLADVLPAGEENTEAETGEGEDEFPHDEKGAYVLQDGLRIRLTEQLFYSQSQTVESYSVSKSGNNYISKNFQVKEFACKDGSDTVLIDSKLVEILQKIRDHFGKPLTITSGYRTETHNKKVGGASRSYHLYGMAADIKVSGHTPSEVAAYAEQIGVKGIGLYSTWVHVDTRTSKYYWNSIGSSTYEQKTFLSGSSRGDVDGDGQVTVKDALLVVKHMIGLASLEQSRFQMGDLNGDGKCNVYDAYEILKMSVGV